MTELLVSVVVPALNEERYVAAALASVRGQTVGADGIETIVVDNASGDRTSEVVRAFVAETGMPVLLGHEPKVGTAAAKNRGASRARGEILLFLDADSRAAPDLVAAVVARWERGERAASVRVVADSSDPLDRGFFALMEVGKDLFGVRAQMFWCARSLFERCGGFDERMLLGEDRDFLVRLARTGVAVGHLRESRILTSPRRLHTLPLRLGMVTMFGRWALAHAGVGREWPY